MIRPYSLTEAAQWLGATAPLVELSFTGVSTDSRTLKPGDLFVALRGESFDGHGFLEQAKSKGAVAAVVETVDSSLDLPQLQVANSLTALGQLAAANRKESTAGFLGITGSSGKTTVKEMAAAILAGDGETLATRGNLNNHIGVPLTLFRVAPEHRFAVIEMGASAVGEIAYTVAMARPDVALITNAGEAHLEGFGGYQNIVTGKGEIIDGVPSSGLVVLNFDDPAFAKWKARAAERHVLSVSAQGDAADYRAELLDNTPEIQGFRVIGPDGWTMDIALPLKGVHNITNALLAIAACRGLGATDTAVKTGLESMVPVKGRLQFVPLGQQVTLIDDSYNANPSSMKAALGALAQQTGTKIAILGAMAELGEDTRQLHQEVGEEARLKGIDHLLTVGKGCEGYAEGFGEHAEQCIDHADAVNRLIKRLAGPTTVLVKGSRSSAMDRVVEGIKEKVDDTCCSG